MSLKNETAGDPVIARDATYHRAPESLRASIHAAVAQERRKQARPQLWRWGGLAAAFAATALVTWNVALFQARNGDDAIARDVVAAHVRSLMGESRLNDVASSDQHTVKPWFQGKVAFGPAVYEPPADSGFTLVGGRLDYIDGRSVAAITYRRKLHAVNLFEWPASDTSVSAPELATRHGYALVRWKRGGLEYWLVSDAAGADLLKFAELIAAS